MDYVEGPTLDRWFAAQPAGRHRSERGWKWSPKSLMRSKPRTIRTFIAT